MRAYLRFIIVGCLFVAMGSPLFSQIQLSQPTPEVGETLTLTFPEPTSEVVVTYRPNSQVFRTDTLRSATPTTQFEWTAENPGVVALAGGGQTRNVSVRFAGVSWSGIFVMLLAGTLLFGGATLAFRVLFRDEEEDGTLDLDPVELPDT